MAKKKQVKHISIAGNIGAGKTTLTELLSKHYGWGAQYEDVENNPYLNDFYNDMYRWSFNLQVYFLQSRLTQIFKIKEGDETIIQDRTIYEDAKIFAKNLHMMGLMTQRDFTTYEQLFDTIKHFISPPDLIIYLRASVSTLVEQIQKRGREYEESLRLDYLNRLNDLYNNWADNYKDGRMLIIDIDDLNFKDNKEDLALVINKVDAELNGLF